MYLSLIKSLGFNVRGLVTHMVSHHHLVQGQFAKEAVSLFVEHCMIFVVSLIKVRDAIVFGQTRIELRTV